MNQPKNDIATTVMFWNSVDEAVDYFIGQDRIDVLNKFEIQSVRMLAHDMELEFDDLVEKLLSLFNSRK